MKIDLHDEPMYPDGEKMLTRQELIEAVEAGIQAGLKGTYPDLLPVGDLRRIAREADEIAAGAFKLIQDDDQDITMPLCGCPLTESGKINFVAAKEEIPDWGEQHSFSKFAKTFDEAIGAEDPTLVKIIA